MSIHVVAVDGYEVLLDGVESASDLGLLTDGGIGVNWPFFLFLLFDSPYRIQVHVTAARERVHLSGAHVPSSR